jgi:hypothetical protein
MKWAVRLLMKLKKDIQKNYQKDLIDILTNQDDDTNPTLTLASGISKREPTNACKCIVSNPDMKGKTLMKLFSHYIKADKYYH